MREIRTSGSEGGGAETNRRSLPLFFAASLTGRKMAKVQSVPMGRIIPNLQAAALGRPVSRRQDF